VTEIEKVKSKIATQQARLRELELCAQYPNSR